jgi:flagellar hook assembly protein FlgD
LSIVDKFALLSNYPNPFNPETQIDYELHVDGQVDLSIYNINGQLVSNLVSTNLEAGSYNVIWNGMDSNGAEVASGVYIMQLKTDNEIISNKITLLR